MRRMLAGVVLVVLTTMTGCVQDADVKKGLGETAVLQQQNNRYTGAVDVRGHVVNTGVRTAKDVVLRFQFFSAGNLYLEGTLLLGDLSGGNTQNFSGTFYGPQVDPATFTWDYRIEWD